MAKRILLKISGESIADKENNFTFNKYKEQRSVSFSVFYFYKY